MWNAVAEFVPFRFHRREERGHVAVAGLAARDRPVRTARGLASPGHVLN